MAINFIGCADAGGASTAIDALRSSAHPMSSLYFAANNQGNNMTNTQVFRQPSNLPPPIKATAPLTTPSPSWRKKNAMTPI